MKTKWLRINWKEEIVTTMRELAAEGIEEAYGYQINAHIKRRRNMRVGVAHGNLYRALFELVANGKLTARRETKEQAEKAGRPRRRYYRIEKPEEESPNNDRG